MCELVAVRSGMPPAAPEGGVGAPLLAQPARVQHRRGGPYTALEKQLRKAMNNRNSFEARAKAAEAKLAEVEKDLNTVGTMPQSTLQSPLSHVAGGVMLCRLSSAASTSDSRNLLAEQSEMAWTRARSPRNSRQR